MIWILVALVVIAILFMIGRSINGIVDEIATRTADKVFERIVQYFGGKSPSNLPPPTEKKKNL